MQHLCAVFGTHADTTPLSSLPLQLKQHHKRFDMVIQHLSKRLLAQIRQLPRPWLISAKLQMSRNFAQDSRNLAALGFTFTGLMPTSNTHGWFALFHRGTQSRHLNLHCPHMQRLHDDLQQNANTQRSAEALNRARSAA